MGKHETLGIYDYDREKICDLYDSQCDLIGQAYDIKVTKEIDGKNTLEFSLPYIDGAKNISLEELSSNYGLARFGISRYGRIVSMMPNQNYRWMFMKSDYLIRYTRGNEIIWFVASKPKKSRNNKTIVGTVTCNGFEILLKTRNIYMEFDDENGIGTIDYLMAQILNGTGWTYNDKTHGSDTLYERDGTTEKIRSLKSDGKKGALDLITTTCNLFQARPVFDTDRMTVTIKAMKNRHQVLEGTIGRNLSAMSVQHDASNIATRVYVEGEYSDDGYVGIDDVIVDGEKYGLSYIMNFDYYREIGVFKDRHEAALATYIADIKAKKQEIYDNGVLLIAAQDDLNDMIGQCNLVVYYKSQGYSTPKFVYGEMTDDQKTLHVGDNVVIVRDDGRHTYEEWANTSAQMASAYAVAKFVTASAGTIGTAEVQIEAKEKSIEQLQRKINVTVKEDKIAEYEAEIQRLKNEIDSILTGYEAYDTLKAYAINDKCSHRTGDNTYAYKCTTAIGAHTTEHAWNASEWTQITPDGLFKMMQDLVKNDGLLYQYDYYEAENARLNDEQDDIEATFIAAMGYMLRDGYWNNNNYTLGQEQYLYDDAIDVTKEMSKPDVSYTFSYVRVSEDFDVPADEIEVNAIFKIHDEDLEVDDNMFIKKVTYGVDNRSLGSIEVSNQDITLTGNDLGSLISRMSQLADLVEQKNALYERAKAISNSGSIYADRLNGQIDVVKNQILSSVSNWYTDDRGNIIFEDADGSSAMMLSGAGFMLASSKDDSGEWNWRTLGTGQGITADEIIAGFISADRIESGTISTAKITSDFGQNLMISSSQYINLSVTNFDSLGEIESGIYLSPTAVKINSGGTFELHATNLDISTDGTVSARSIALTGGSIALKDGNTTKFSVNNNGYMTSVYGNIAGWEIGNTTLTGNKTGLAKTTNDADIAIWAGNATASNAAFRVTQGGVLYASGAVISGDSTFSGTLSANCITSGTLSADRISGGTLDASAMTVANLSANSITGGSINASDVTITNINASNITTGDLNAGRIKGGTLTLGGTNNGNGTLLIKDASNNDIGSWTNQGITTNAGVIGGWSLASKRLSSGTSTGYVAMDSNTSGTYAIWSGAETASSAPFRVKRNGEVTLTKLLALAEDGVTETEVNLRTANLWKLSYRTVKTFSASENNGTVTLTLGCAGGDLSVNFSRATSVSLSGSWGGNIFTVSDSGGSGASYSETFTAGKGTGNQSAGGQYTINEFSSSYKAYGYVNASSLGGGNGRLYTFNVDASGVYSAGETAGATAARAAVTLTGTWSGNTFTVTNSANAHTSSTTISFSPTSNTINTFNASHKATATVSATGISGAMKTWTIDASGEYSSGVSAGASGVTLSAAGWVGGSNVVSASNGKSVTVNLPTITLSGGTSFSSHKTTVYASGGGASGYIASLEVDATGEYNSGVSSGSSGVTLSAAGWVGGSNVVSASNGKSVTVNLPTISLTGGTSFSSHKTTVYASGGGASGYIASLEVNATSEYNAGWNACRQAMLDSATTLGYYTGTSTYLWSAPHQSAQRVACISPYASHSTTLYTVPDAK